MPGRCAETPDRDPSLREVTTRMRTLRCKFSGASFRIEDHAFSACEPRVACRESSQWLAEWPDVCRLDAQLFPCCHAEHNTCTPALPFFLADQPSQRVIVPFGAHEPKDLHQVAYLHHFSLMLSHTDREK